MADIIRKEFYQAIASLNAERKILGKFRRTIEKVKAELEAVKNIPQFDKVRSELERIYDGIQYVSKTGREEHEKFIRKALREIQQEIRMSGSRREALREEAIRSQIEAEITEILRVIEAYESHLGKGLMDLSRAAYIGNRREAWSRLNALLNDISHIVLWMDALQADLRKAKMLHQEFLKRKPVLGTRWRRMYGGKR